MSTLQHSHTHHLINRRGQLSSNQHISSEPEITTACFLVRAQEHSSPSIYSLTKLFSCEQNFLLIVLTLAEEELFRK